MTRNAIGPAANQCPSSGATLAPRSLWMALAILGLTVAAYFPALRAGYIWDDDSYLTHNRQVQSARGLATIWREPRASPQYYPLVFTSFWIEYRLWGLNPIGYHVVNVLLHAGSAILVWRLLQRLRVPGAFFAGIVFSLHPMQVESVAWITERKNVLSGLFYLGAMCAYSRLALPQDAPVKRPRMQYVLALFLFVCALLSKSVTATLPAAILVIIWWKRGRLSGRDVFALLPFFVIGISAAAHTAWLEKHHVGAGEVAWGLSALDRCLLAGRIIWFYLAKLLWPADLIFFYPRWQIDASQWWQYVYPIGVIGLSAALWTLRRRIGRGPLAAWLFFCGTLVPVLGFVKVYPMVFSYVADHFQYLACLGPIMLVVGAAAQALRGERMPAGRALRGFAASAVVIACLSLTWRRCGAYKDEETLWRDTLARNHAAWAAYNNLGIRLRETGRKDEALQMFRQAVEIRPDYVEALDNLGFSLLERHQEDEAFALFTRAVESDRYFASAQRNLGRMLCDRSQIEDGIPHLRAATLLQPDSHESHEDLGNALYKQGHVDKAILEYREVLRLKQDYALGLCNLGVALFAAGRADGALTSLRQAVALDPKLAIAHYTLGSIEAAQGRGDEAVAHFGKALESQPNYAMAHENLAIVLAGQGRPNEAIEHFQLGSRQAPNDPNLRFNLARALEGLGRRDEAIKEYREALRLNPGDQEARKGLDAALQKADSP